MDRKQLKYSKEHLWVSRNEDAALIGLSDYALRQLGTVVFLNLPEAGERFAAGDVFGDIESVKSVSDLIFPADGEIVQGNEALLDSPERLYEDMEKSWLVKATIENYPEDLMDADEYEQYLEKL